MIPKTVAIEKQFYKYKYAEQAMFNRFANWSMCTLKYFHNFLLFKSVSELELKCVFRIQAEIGIEKPHRLQVGPKYPQIGTHGSRTHWGGTHLAPQKAAGTVLWFPLEMPVSDACRGLM